MKVEILDYFLLFFFIFFSFGISVLILKLHYLLTPQVNSLDKMVGYECGYDPFGDARSNFNVQFYLVGILFLIFDLEIAFLFPWSVSAISISFLNFLIIYVFLFLLGIGFVFEYKKGALYW